MESYGVIGMHIYRNYVSILLSRLCINLHDIPQVACLFHGMLVKFFPTEEMGTSILWYVKQHHPHPARWKN